MRSALISSLLLVVAGTALAALLGLVVPRIVPGAGRRVGLRDAALGFSLAVILVVTMRPTGDESQVQLRPFSEIWAAITRPGEHALALQAIGNVLLFVPLGVALRLRGSGWRLAGAVACVLAASVELTQLAIPGRTTAVDDVLLNTAGAVVGNLALQRVRRRQ